MEEGRFFSRGKPLRFTEADAKLEQLKALLLTHGVVARPGSKLGEILQSTKKYLALHRREESLPPTTDLRDEWVRMLGLVDFAVKLITASETQFFPALLPHLKLFAEAEDPSQNAKTEFDDYPNHKLFELLIGAACTPFADGLLVEAPDKKTKVRTPDVTVTWRRRRWGIACKVLQSTKPERYRDQIMKGIWQIDQCDVDRGVVMINVKNLIPFETFMPFGRKSQTEPYEIFKDDTWTEHIEGFRRELRKRVEAETGDIAKAFQT